MMTNACQYKLYAIKFALLSIFVTISVFAMPAQRTNGLHAQEFSISWFTIDGGGGMSVGGPFDLNGTVGQPDAGLMVGGAYSITGGYWAASFQDDFLLGDVNMDGAVNLLDVAPFVELISTGGFKEQADINQDGFVNLLDVEPFIELLSG